MLLGISLNHFATSALGAIVRGVADFPIFLRHARHFVETGVLYPFAGDLSAYEPAAPVYKFPPLYAVFLVPVVRHGIPTYVNGYHWALQILLYAGAVTVGIRTLARRGRYAFPFLALILALNFEPFFETLWRLQLETPILLTLFLFLWAARSGRDGWSGAALGFSAMLKIYPAFLLGLAALRRRWKALAGAAIAAVLVQALTLAVLGLEPNRVFFFRILPALLGESVKITTENLSIARYLHDLAGLGAEAAALGGRIAGLALLAVSVAALRPLAAPRRDPNEAALSLALFVPLMLLLMPNAWVNYQLLLLPAYFVLLERGLAAGGRRRAVVLGVLGLGAAALLFYQPCAPPDVPWPCAETPWFLGLVRLPRGLHDAGVDLRIVGTLAPWALALALTWRARREPARWTGAIGTRD